MSFPGRVVRFEEMLETSDRYPRRMVDQMRCREFITSEYGPSQCSRANDHEGPHVLSGMDGRPQLISLPPKDDWP